jgi:hypothetical protein
MIRRAPVGAVLVAIGLLTLPSASMANALDIPAAVPPQFRALLRARLHMSPPRHGFESRLALKAQHGLELSVIGEGDIVTVEVTRPERRKSALERLLGIEQAVTAYVARGTVTPNRIAASFGKFGRVDVRFRPSGRAVGSHFGRRCKGADHFTSRFGVFVGGVRFSGENRYVAVRAHRAKGRVRSPLHLRCAQRRFQRPARSWARPIGQHPNSVRAFLTAGWRHAVSSTELLALRGRRTTLFLAISEESMGAMAEVRYGFATTPSKVFVVDDALTSATVEPPAPFIGKGIYHAEPDGTTSWAGSLAVSFPGAPRLPLASEQFEATLESSF